MGPWSDGEHLLPERGDQLPRLVPLDLGELHVAGMAGFAEVLQHLSNSVKAIRATGALPVRSAINMRAAARLPSIIAQPIGLRCRGAYGRFGVVYLTSF